MTGSVVPAVVSVDAESSDAVWVQSQTDTGETLCRAGCCTITFVPELNQPLARHVAGLTEAMGLPSPAFLQDLKTSPCTQVVQVLAFYLLQRRTAIHFLSRGTQ